eukprot:1149647-Pelagomonas_calceolata.AAC.2
MSRSNPFLTYIYTASSMHEGELPSQHGSPCCPLKPFWRMSRSNPFLTYTYTASSTHEGELPSQHGSPFRPLKPFWRMSCSYPFLTYVYANSPTQRMSGSSLLSMALPVVLLKLKWLTLHLHPPQAQRASAASPYVVQGGQPVQRERGYMS